MEVFKPGKFVTTLFVNQVRIKHSPSFFFYLTCCNLNEVTKSSSPSVCPMQSSKCRSVFSSAQKLEGYKRLDRQLAQFNDYNFVFTSYTKNRQQNQQS